LSNQALTPLLDFKVAKVDRLFKLVHDWPVFLAESETEASLKALRHLERIGRPLGNNPFLGVCRTIGIVTRKWGGEPNLVRI